ncbi:MAG: ribbon-helix-helix protein, CopG family [Chloroflexota bacterium]
MLTMPVDLLQVVDAQAQHSRQNRSQFVRRVLREWIEQQRQKEFEVLLAEGYQAMAQESTAIAAENLIAQTAAAEGVWRWDD